MRPLCYFVSLLFVVLINAPVVSAAQEQAEKLTINATTTDFEGATSKDITETDNLTGIFKLQKQLVYKLLQNIGITPDKLSTDVKNAINKPQTTNVDAFQAFCNCLDLTDKKQYAKAREQCDEAVKLDPNFAMAANFGASIPDEDQTMPEIVDDHLGRSLASDQEPYIRNIPAYYPPDNTIKQVVGNNCETGASPACQVKEVDQSSPPCDKGGTCGFYSTFLASRSPNGPIKVASSPFLNRTAVAIPPTNTSGKVQINQIGQEGKGYLQAGVTVSGFREGEANVGNNNVSNVPIERVVTEQLQTGSGITGLELGAYFTGLDFTGALGAANGSSNVYDFFHGALYFAEGTVTPADTIKTLGKVKYEGIVNGDFSVNGNLVPCQGTCGQFTGSLNYAASKLEQFRLDANASQVIGTQTAAARITANNVDLRPTGEFQFDQKASGASFQVGTNVNNLSNASGVVAGRPFGGKAELLGGVFAIHGGNIQGAGNFGGKVR